ncbi:MAG: molybdopterin molybdotransferase MoeA [Anaerolineae bacterium]
MRESPYPMLSREEAWQRIAAVVRPLAARSLPLGQVAGCVLAEDVTAADNMPPFASSAMDGFAVIAGDSGEERRIVGEQDAGARRAPTVTPGTAVRIMTGAPLPPGADAVIPVERTQESGNSVRLLGPMRPGENVRPIGQDVAAGETVLQSGAILRPGEIGLLASIGHTSVSVRPRPRVAVLATGSELVEPDATPGPGQIRDSNSAALTAAVAAAGCEPVYLGRVGDDRDLVRRTLLRGVAEADMLVTSGGVSMGARDYVKPLLAELGTVHFGRVAIKPGKPLTFATVGDTPVFALPGFPVSSLVCFECFARPALRLMAGHGRLWRPEIPVRLVDDIEHEPDRTEFQRAVVAWRDGVHWARTTGSQVSGRLRSLAGANALLVLPAGRSSFYAGSEVTAILTDQPEVDRDR